MKRSTVIYLAVLALALAGLTWASARLAGAQSPVMGETPRIAWQNNCLPDAPEPSTTYRCSAFVVPSDSDGVYVSRSTTLGTGFTIGVEAYYAGSGPDYWEAFPLAGDSTIATSQTWGCILRTGITAADVCGGGDSTDAVETLPTRLTLAITTGTNPSGGAQVGWMVLP